MLQLIKMSQESSVVWMLRITSIYLKQDWDFSPKTIAPLIHAYPNLWTATLSLFTPRWVYLEKSLSF